MTGDGTARSAFDRYATTYDAALANGLAVSGEGKDYFAAGRVRWLTDRLRGLNSRVDSILDFGCGTGSSAPHLLRAFAGAVYAGVDVSRESVCEARRTHDGSRARFDVLAEREPDGTVDLAFCNGVFHHIPVDQRQEALAYVWRSLRPGGLFAFWENNPLNPGTRYVMSRIPFDRDAITLTARQGQRLLAQAGFSLMHVDFLFLFPRALKSLRFAEAYLSSLPMGAQYQLLVRKPYVRETAAPSRAELASPAGGAGVSGPDA
jgi:SAM-dependent methyltransferase